MFSSRRPRNPVAETYRDLRARFSTLPTSAMAEAPDRAREMSSAAIDQLLVAIDNLGAALSTMSDDASTRAKGGVKAGLDQVVTELKRRPLRSLAIAVGVGAAAGLLAP